MRWLKYSVVTLAMMLLGPLYMFAQGSDVAVDAPRRGWLFANRDSAALAPPAAGYPDAVIQIYAARAWSWRGHLAVHTWIATKAADAESYEVHQVVGFRARRGLPVITSEAGLPDRRWYGNVPQLLVDLRGDEAAALLPRVLAAVREYPYPDSYTLWPGPNSNTFTAHVGRAVPELGLVMPVTAIGKDYLPGGALIAPVPSGTGYQISIMGALGLMVAGKEGIELNVLGLSAGVDFLRPALKLPGIGRLGMAVAPEDQ